MYKNSLLKIVMLFIICGSTQISATYFVDTSMSPYYGNSTISEDMDLGSSSFQIGFCETGYLTIEGGADVIANSSVLANQNSNTEGYVTLNAIGTTWTNNHLYVGQKGYGVVTVQNGAELIDIDIPYLGDYSTGHGIINIIGTGSKWTQYGYSQIGDEGIGEIYVLDGGQVDAKIKNYFAYNEGASGALTVDGANSIWSGSSSYMYMGYKGVGNLTITNGGSIASSRCYLSWSSETTSTNVVIDGADSSWIISSYLYVANTGSAEIWQKNGTVSANTKITLAYGVGGTGTYKFAGGTLSTESLEKRSGTGVFDWTGGTLKATSVKFSVTNAGGTLNPGRSIGTTTIEGDYTQQSTGTLKIEIGGISIGEYDKLVVQETLTLGGNLIIEFADGYTPTENDSWDFIDWNSLTGTFSSITFPEGTVWNESDLYTNGTLTITSVADPNTPATVDEEFTFSENGDYSDTELVIGNTGTGSSSIESSVEISNISTIYTQTEIKSRKYQRKNM